MDEVNVLVPDNTNKLISNLQMPNRVLKKLNDCVYDIEKHDASVCRLHVNKTVLCLPSVQMGGLTSEDEKDFGTLPCYDPSPGDSGPCSQDIDRSDVDLDHHNSVKQTKTCDLSVKHRNVFNDKPCTDLIGEDRLDVSFESVLKKPPDKLLAEVA